MKQQSYFDSEAVSPVIGVMLMLVVTIIVAAAVSAFAGGFADDQKETPIAQIDVQLKAGKDCPRLVFTHLGGDPLKTGDLKIVTYYHDINRTKTGIDLENSNVYRHVTDGSLDPSDALNRFDPVDYQAGGSVTTNDGYPCTVSNGVPVKYWGNSTMLPGDVYTTTDAASLESVIATRDVNDERVEVEIIHVPSGKVIFSGEVFY